jgi:ribosomal protein S18 acetylase RimI-like enzyme
MGVTIRSVATADREDVWEMLAACGAFSAEEIRVALEMMDAGLNGEYSLVGAELDGRLRGYACVGKAALTLSSWYLYWICVHPEAQRAGVGRLLQAHIEEFVRDSGGDRLVLETSGRPDYERTRRFYDRAGFAAVGRIPDFYKPGDDCVIYLKLLGAPT